MRDVSYCKKVSARIQRNLTIAPTAEKLQAPEKHQAPNPKSQTAKGEIKMKGPVGCRRSRDQRARLLRVRRLMRESIILRTLAFKIRWAWASASSKRAHSSNSISSEGVLLSSTCAAWQQPARTASISNASRAACPIGSVTSRLDSFTRLASRMRWPTSLGDRLIFD